MLLKKSPYIIKIGSGVLSVLVIIFLWHDIPYKDTIKFGHHYLVEPSSYVLEKLKNFDIVFLGTRHRQKCILDFISGILPRLHEAGVSHIGLEIASDQQPYIDYYMENGFGVNNIKLHQVIDCPEYRDLLKTIKELGQKNMLKPVALDLPPSLYGFHWNRDEYMAISICRVLDRNPDAKILVVVGNLHALKNIAWDENVPNKNGVIRSYLSQYEPDLKVFSICQYINDASNENDPRRDFTKNIITVAFDCTGGFSNCKMDILETVASKPMKASEIVDGIIMFWESKENPLRLSLGLFPTSNCALMN